MDADVLIIGAGAAGLMAARELGRAGKKVLVLEARDRVGGRILPLDESEFGYPAQGGAEWVHGAAPVTKALIKEAGLSIAPEGTEIWSIRSGGFEKVDSFAGSSPALRAALEALVEDVPLAEFMNTNFSGPEHENFRNSILKAAEGYDAADTRLVSTLMLKDAWLSNSEWHDGRIEGGYTALLAYLESECKKYGVQTRLNTIVTGIDIQASCVGAHNANGVAFKAKNLILTVPLPVLQDIVFNPELAWKQQVAREIGWGHAIKVLIKFKTRWWNEVRGKDLSAMAFFTSNEKFLTWWTQYPAVNSVLTGWMAGPEAQNYKSASQEEILDAALHSLASMCAGTAEELKKQIELYRVFNWPADPYAKGAYSYTTYKTGDAYDLVAQPYDNVIYFAGEALYSGDATATVEGALGSGLETAQMILAASL